MSEKYYYNLSTGEIEQGRLSRGLNRMGPYETFDEARQALANARERNDAWEDADTAWAEDDLDGSAATPAEPAGSPG